MAKAEVAPAGAPTGSWITNVAWLPLPGAGLPAPGVTPTPALPALPIFAKDFSVATTVASATLAVTGEGVYTVQIDGQPVSPAVLEPGYSVDSKVWYSDYDVTALLSSGSHRLSTQLGQGMWSLTSSILGDGRAARPNAYHVAGPLGFNLTLSITYADGSTDVVQSDTSWKTHLGGTTFSTWYGGEDYDARVLPGWVLPTTALDNSWTPAVAAPALNSLVLAPKIGAPIEQVDTITAKTVTQHGSAWVFDLGTQLSGWAQLTVTAPQGATITMRPSERLGSNGLVDQTSMKFEGSIFDRYTAAGTGPEVWHEQFRYTGFRYVQVEGLPTGQAPTLGMITGLVLRTAVAATGTFSSSDKTLSGVHTLVNRAMQSNMYSVLTDCPDREKLGWLEETWLVYPALADNFDMHDYARRIEQIIADGQSTVGRVAATAPEYFVFPPPYDVEPNWSGAVVELPWQMYQAHADRQVLSDFWPVMQSYATYMTSRASNNLITSGLGDWVTIAPHPPSATLIASIGWAQTLYRMADIGAVLGNGAAAAAYRAQGNTVAAAINAQYLKSGQYGSDPGSNAFALDAGIVPAASVGSVRAAMINAVVLAKNHLQLGEVTLPAALHQLSAAGRDDLIYQAVIATDQPGFGYMAASGATALTESWSGLSASDGGRGSQDHFMLGAIDDWLISRVAGISRTAGTVGDANLTIAPQLLSGVGSVSATKTTSAGQVATSWQRNGSAGALTVTVPSGVTAHVVLPWGTFTAPAGTTVYTGQIPPPPPPPTKPVNTLGQVYSVPISPVLYRLVGATLTPISFEQWQANGFPTPVRAQLVTKKYTWSAVVYAVSVAPAVGPAFPLTFAQWQTLGRLAPTTTSVITGSAINRWAGSPELLLSSPDGTVHHLTGPEWAQLGHPAFVSQPDSWVPLAGGPKLLRVNLITGVGHWATGPEWAQAGYPTPLSPRPIPHERWVLDPAPQVVLILVGGATIPITLPEWIAAGEPLTG